jgi:cysteinyl-tRNA synthetase
MPLRYSLEALDAAEAGIQRMRQAFKAGGRQGGEVLDAEAFKARFVEAMDDDFNAPQAVAAMFDLVREINRGSEKGMDVGKAQEMLKELAAVIGFTLQDGKKLSGEEAAKIEDLIARRNEYRKAREWKLADGVRDQLASMGVAIEDTAKGTSWKVSR